MDQELLDKVAEASRITGLSQADILRLAVAIGLEDLRKVGYDLAGLVSDAVHGKSSKSGLSLVAEEPEEPGKQSPPSTHASGARYLSKKEARRKNKDA